MSKKTILTLLKTLLPLILGVYLIWIFFSNMAADPRKMEAFYRAIGNANYSWIIISLVPGVIAYLSRAYRWKYVLEPLGYETKFWNRYHAVMIGYLINLTIPRAGEASRSGMLFRSDGVPFSSSFGTIIAERAVDFVILCAVALLTAFLGYDDFIKIKEEIFLQFGSKSSDDQLSYTFVFFVIVSVIGLFFSYLFIFRASFRLKFISFIKDVVKGLLSIFKSRQPFSYLLHTILIWGCYIVMFALPFQALDETSRISFSGILLGFIAGSLGITFTNGGIGTYPLLVGLVVSFYIGNDYPEDAQGIGNALGMVVWLSQTLLMIILGLISLILLPNNYSKQ